MKIRVVQFESNNAKSEIIVNYRTDINTGEEFISVAVRNHMDINPSFFGLCKNIKWHRADKYNQHVFFSIKI